MTIFERFVALPIHLADRALNERLQHYTNTLTSIIGQALAAEATVTVKAGIKVFTNTSVVSRRRGLQAETLPPGSYARWRAGSDCEEGYTPVEATITMTTPIPTSKVTEVVQSLPSSVVNEANATVYRCGAVETVFNELDRIPAPSPPPASDPEEIVWWAVWGLVAVFSLACCCCGIYGVVVWRRDRRPEPNPWDKGKKREALYQTERERRDFYRGAGRERAPVVFAAALERTVLGSGRY